ncbi:MAG: hypothetical protein ACRER3_00360 [Pseudomonas fluorescens]
MGFPDWGDVPGWFGAGSLVLAFQLFRRDRAVRDRAQVDQVGVWFEVDREISLPGEPHNNQVRVKTFIRNSSKLPIEVTQIAWEVRTRWWTPEEGTEPLLPNDHPWHPGVFAGVDGGQDAVKYTGPILVAPEATVSGDWLDLDLGHVAPTESARLDWLPNGVEPVLRRVLVTDNAGRRWETRHTSGRPARRIRRYSRAGENYPSRWMQQRFQIRDLFQRM